MFKLCAVTAVAAGAALAVSLGTAASASTSPISGSGFANATTSLTNHPDSSNQGGGTWAMDNFTRKATVMFTGFAPAADCAGAPAGSMCFKWTGSVTDTGTFTTIKDALGPRLGKEEQALTGSFTGGSTTVTFYTDSLAASAAGVPRTVAGAPLATEATSVWVEQFFPKGNVFGDSIGKWSWSYAMPAGTDKLCPRLAAQKWVDDYVTGGSNASTNPLVDNVITPIKADC